MQRYRIMLVEDEIDVRDRIARSVDWEECGFELCALAGGAIEALELARKTVPDVVMTDIRMPYMNGLELIAQLRERYPAMQFVILSGYDEFSYAQQALEFRVMDYLLKPLSREGMVNALNKIRARLDAEMMRGQDSEALRISAEKMRWQLASMQLMSMLLENSTDAGEMTMQRDIRFPAYLAVMKAVDAQEQKRVLEENFQGREDLMQTSMLSIINEQLWKENRGTCVIHGERVVLLLYCDKEEGIALMEGIMDHLRMVLRLPFKAMFSEKVDKAQELSAMYQRMLLMGHETAYGAGSVYLMEESQPPELVVTQLDQLTGEILHHLRSGDEKSIEAVFDKLLKRLEETGAQSAVLETFYVMVTSSVLTAVMRSGAQTEALVKMMDQPVHYPLEMRKVIRHLCTFACTACAQISEQRNRASRKMMGEITDYIEAHFGDPSLSIQEICEKFGIGQTQLSLLFRREMDTSFLQYVLEKRIARAQALLRGSDRKIYEIAMETGFEDPGYFAYCFKQRTGMTPKNYRQGAREKNA